MADRCSGEDQLLVFAPLGRDAVLATQVLEQGGMSATICGSADELVSAIGAGAGGALVAQEALSLPVIAALARALRTQPPWSDFPLIIFMPRTASAFENRKALEAFADLGNVTALEKPIHPLTMVSAARAALRARNRQYAARAALEERERDVRQRDQFLARLGHELRNPLGALRNASRLLERDAARLSQVPSPLAIIDRQISTLTLLVDDLLDVARVTSGKISLKVSPVDLVALVRNLVDEAGRSSRERRVRLSLEAPASPVIVMGDRIRTGTRSSTTSSPTPSSTRAAARVVASRCRSRTATPPSCASSIPASASAPTFSPRSSNRSRKRRRPSTGRRAGWASGSA